MKKPSISTINCARFSKGALLKFCFTMLVALGMQTGNSQTPLPIYEPFPTSYTNGAPDETVAVPATNTSTFPARRLRNGTTATLWSIGGTPGGGSTLVVGGPTALSYPGLYHDPGTPSIGVYVRTNLTTANRTAGILFPTISSGSVYASFLINVQQNPATTNRCLVKFETATTGAGSTGGSGAMAGVFLTASGQLGLSKSSTTVVGITNDTVLAAGTHLVVARYTFNGGTDDDEIALWLDPGSLNEPTDPTPSLTWATGTDVPSISSFYIQTPQNGPPQVPASFFLDEIRIANNWAEVTSTQALCTAVSISTQPSGKTVNEGIAGFFSIIAGGTSPAFQWQVSTNGGSSWNNVIGGLGGTSQSYQTPPTSPINNGNLFRCIATVSCGGGSSVTSAPASLTVVSAVVTPVGVVVDDLFQDGYNSIPYGISNSIWFSSDSDSLNIPGSLTSMLGTVPTTSVTWLGYFTDDSTTNLPVHLSVGHALKGSLDFKASNIVSNGGNFRIGFFDYADGSTRIANNNFGTSPAGSTNVLGYMTTFNFGTNFTGNPFSLFARNNLGSTDLMGTTGNYLSLGNGPANYAGAPAFQNDTPYTVEFTLARKTVDTIVFTTTVSGGGTNWSHTVIDSSYAYPRFDSVAVRAGSAATAASSFEFTRLLVQVVSLPKIPLNITTSGTNAILTWTNASYILQSATAVNGPYSNVSGAASPYTTPITGTQRYFRLN